jgi:hypothetical protein
MSPLTHVPDVPESTPAVARRPWVPPALTLESMRDVAAGVPGATEGSGLGPTS